MEVIVNEILDYFKKNLPVPFSSSAYYELRYTIGVSLPNGRNKRNHALKSLANWICKHEVLLRNMMMHWPMGPYGPCHSDHSVYGKPDGFQCEFELLCWPYATLTGLQPGSFWLRAAYPENIKPLIRERLISAFLKKCKKLQSCKSEGARTVLVLESMDSALTHFEFRGDLLPDVLARHSNVPDEIFLVQTNSDHWRVVPLQYANGHWSDIGMPQLGVSYYDPKNSGFPKWLDSQPQHIREGLQLDQMQTPFDPGFAIESFKEDELNDLTQA